MPNHVTNVVHCQNPDVINHLMVLDKGADSVPHVSFSTVIPIPDDDDPIFTATKTEYGNGMQGWSVDGYCPMDWAREHWGTKWDAYNCERLNDTSVSFQTAWSTPLPVFEKLSSIFPDDVIYVEYADEDLGNNCGSLALSGGAIQEEVDSQSLDNPQDFAAQLVYGMSYAELEKQYEDEV